MDRPTLDQLAQLTEPQMVRNRFDEQNLDYGIRSFFAVTSLVLVPVSFVWKQQQHLLHAIVAICDALLSLFIIGVITELRYARRENWRPHAYARMAASNLSGWLVAVLIVKFATLIYFAPANKVGWIGWYVWGIILPPTTVAIRLLLSQRVILHAMMLALFAVAFFADPPNRNQADPVGLCILLTTVNLVCFVAGALISRRIGKDAINEGTQVRIDARNQVRIRDDLRRAHDVQSRMLPEGPPKLPWADIAGVSIPATDGVGGDYYGYDVVEGRLAIVCGDVAGHGLGSGVALSALAGALGLLRGQLDNPAHVLERLQEAVMQSSRDPLKVTMSMLLLDAETQHATIASAAHPPLILVHSATRTAELIEFSVASFPLGSRLVRTVPQRVVPFESGDTFVLHTDGIDETTNSNGEQYGIDRLGRVVAACDGTAEEVLDTVLRDVEEFRGAKIPQDDDVTIVVVRIA